VAGVALALALVDRELAFAAAGAADPLRAVQLELGWWLVIAAAGVRLGRGGDRLAQLAAALAGAIAAFLARVLVTSPASGLAFVNPRFVLVAATCALIAAIAWQSWRRGDELAKVQPLVALAAVVALWLLASHEAWTQARAGVDDVERARWLGHAALSCAWSVMAAATLAAGFMRREPIARVAGLAMFGVTAGKILIVDLARVEQGYRVLSLAVLGVLLLGASWLYHRHATGGERGARD
jgi:hypothetical protein